MFPYSDSLSGQKGFYGVTWIILAMSAFYIAMSYNETLNEWSIVHLSFVPIYFSLSPWAHLHTLVSSTFLHADILHILGNCLFLWVFGRSLEHLFGLPIFLALFPFLGATGLLLHWVINPDSGSPVIGASGAIATLMGAYLTLFPNARMKMILVLGIFFKRFTVPAWTFLFYWVGLQLLSMVFGSDSDNHDNVAYAVHVGGFMVGVLSAMIWKVSYPFAEEHLSEFTESAFKP